MDCPVAIIEEASAVALPTRAYLATVLRPHYALEGQALIMEANGKGGRLLIRECLG